MLQQQQSRQTELNHYVRQVNWMKSIPSKYVPIYFVYNIVLYEILLIVRARAIGQAHCDTVYVRK